MTNNKKQIAKLNDVLRETFSSGEIVLTQGIQG